MARASVREIADALEQTPKSLLPGFKGEASTALLLAECDRASAHTRLDAALTASVAHPPTVSLFGGICGVSWLIHHLVEQRTAASIVAHLDDVLLRYLEKEHWNEGYGLVSGLAGIGVHISGRQDHGARRIADRILFHLGAAAPAPDVSDGRTRLPSLAGPQREPGSDWVAALSIADGFSGVIGMLARFVETDLLAERSRRLLEPAADWLISAVHDAGVLSSYRAHDVRNGDLGWCYGYPGIATALLLAGRALRSARLEAAALTALTRAIPLLSSQSVDDCSFWRGAAGLAQIYNTAYQQTGDPLMRSEATRWLMKLLALRRPGQGIAGYKSRAFGRSAGRPELDICLHTGVVGVALVLLAAIEDRVPTWQTLFLL